ncbi:MAG: substrate-binding periplasmic protein [Desulforhopalus sp.]
MTTPLSIRIVTGALCLYIAFILTACMSTSTTAPTSNGLSPDKALLRVGVSANAPPLVYKKGNTLQGLEVDFARQLAGFLGREPHFVTLAWEDQLPALEEGKIDIIMSGMTITPKRAYRVAFAKPYMRSGQMLLVRMKEARRYSSGIYSLMGNKPAIGTIKDTTGDFFITKTINRPNITRFKTSKRAVKALIDGEIDVFVHDAPIVCHFAAMSESAKITPILQLATEEFLAWPVNRSDTELLDSVNTFIDESSQKNTLKTTIKRWIPYL